MPPLISDRFRLEVRLGRDRDIEEWLGTDTALDRPVLVRLVGPEATPERRAAFLAAVRAASGVGHVHLAEVYAAGEAEQGAFAVQEWAGGVSLDDRLAAGESVPPEEFLPNGAGLAAALASLHDSGVVHGGISPRAVLFAAAHPAKLSGFGRGAHGAGPSDDTRALARTLAAAAVGAATPAGAAMVAPSEVSAGLPASVDRTLQQAWRGEIDAAGLAAALQAAPTTRAASHAPNWSWNWIVVAAALLVVAVATAVVGMALRVRPSDSPFLFPAVPVTASPATVPDEPTAKTVVTTVPPAAQPAGPVTFAAAAYDPFGDGQERDDDVPLVADGDIESGWRTERYRDPVALVKGGVGLTLDVAGVAGSFELRASDGVVFSLLWSSAVPDEFDGWKHAATGTVLGGRSRIQLPRRDGGTWLLWLTQLPLQDGGDSYHAEVYEVRFEP